MVRQNGARAKIFDFQEYVSSIRARRCHNFRHSLAGRRKNISAFCVPCQKTHPASAHQRRRHAAHCGRGARLYGGAAEGSGAKRPDGNMRPNCCWRRADVGAFSKQIELALFIDAKFDVEPEMGQTLVAHRRATTLTWCCSSRKPLITNDILELTL